ncbi:hypothetical protein [Methanobrevibacter sp. DSM 116169]|uniref:hypothetical protein n=1 Tax=Methanobrevibacter sp. DSM 116169 TaxID=3242727 RepID=UPI0038FCCC82
MILHHLKPNDNYVKNLSKEEIDEIVNLNEPLPNIIKYILKKNIPYFKEKREDVLTEEIINQEKYEMTNSYDMPPLVAAEYRNLLALNFVDRHPKYKSFIESIIDTRSAEKNYYWGQFYEVTLFNS